MPIYRTARECLAAIELNYRALQSYQDIGAVRPIGAPQRISCWFETQFVRPQQFRFQFISPHPYRPLHHIQTKYIVGGDDSTAYFYRKDHEAKPIVEIEENLEMAVAGATGISLGSAHTIGNLLLDCVEGFSLAMLKRPRFRKSRILNGIYCHRISGQHPRGGCIVIWFGAHDLIVRKLVHHRFKHEEVRFSIRTNLPIPSETFHAPKAI